ncbi:hypothetical protein, partial [Mesorhizobium sp. M0040]|uniref:hypothetical protein n=1 Tax=Mesorhizobium sp. M0040 TaxID=2956855 RepID=UPI00333586B1
QLASAQSNVSIGHGTSPSTGIGDRNVTTVPWPLAPQSKRRSLSKTFCRTFSTLSQIRDLWRSGFFVSCNFVPRHATLLAAIQFERRQAAGPHPLRLLQELYNYFPDDLIQIFGDVDIDSLAYRMKMRRRQGSRQAGSGAIFRDQARGCRPSYPPAGNQSYSGME